jgi:hypothetical protein
MLLAGVGGKWLVQPVGVHEGKRENIYFYFKYMYEYF